MVLRQQLETEESGKDVETNGSWNQKKPLGESNKGSQLKSAHVHWACIAFQIKPILWNT